mmetsp:Transcript_10385/g.47654  ORF Transcript_10385/g.47654 Transcript_10385/m.47654 type:complete len:221 (+) Transcript_10385:5942-6604(+)
MVMRRWPRGRRGVSRLGFSLGARRAGVRPAVRATPSKQRAPRRGARGCRAPRRGGRLPGLQLGRRSLEDRRGGVRARGRGRVGWRVRRAPELAYPRIRPWELGHQLHRVLVVLPPLPEPMGLERQPDRLGELVELVELLVLVVVLPSQVSFAQGYARRAVHALKRLLGAHRGRASRERDPFRRRMGIWCRGERFCSAPPRRNPTTRVPPRRPPRVYKPSR